MKQENEKHCTECGAIINIKAEICPKCGVRQPYQAKVVDTVHVEKNKMQEKWIISLLLCWFLGVFGAHRFYSGYIALGVIQLLTFGGCGIWTLIDFIIIVSGNFKDSDGNPIRNS